MKPKILKALRDSIAEWKRSRVDANYLRMKCPLCKLGVGCENCPLQTCFGRSPYKRALAANLAYNRDPTPEAKAARSRTFANIIRYMERRLPKTVAKKGGK